MLEVTVSLISNLPAKGFPLINSLQTGRVITTTFTIN